MPVKIFLCVGDTGFDKGVAGVGGLSSSQAKIKFHGCSSFLLKLKTPVDGRPGLALMDAAVQRLSDTYRSMTIQLLVMQSLHDRGQGNMSFVRGSHMKKPRISAGLYMLDLFVQVTALYAPRRYTP